ncbi:hypothetical protein MAFF212519_11920 [Clavibacter michiganensis]
MTRIMLVEDEASLSEPLAFLLQREGYEVDVVEDGPAAVASFDKDGADLILLDLMLPGLPGTEVCREIRTRSAVPIIMLTAKDSEVDIVVASSSGPTTTSPSRTRRASCWRGSAPCSAAASRWTTSRSTCSRSAPCAWTWSATRSRSTAARSRCR